MEQTEVSAQETMRATCIECETTQAFRLERARPDVTKAEYVCTTCDHGIILDLAPRRS